MSLTPAEVHGVAFSRPPIGMQGYPGDEVDAFLDLVEAELAQLIGEAMVDDALHNSYILHQLSPRAAMRCEQSAIAAIGWWVGKS